MGIAGALHFAAFGLAESVAAPLLKYSFTVRFLTSAAILFLSIVLMFLYKRVTLDLQD